ncbi:MAG: CBS domain-containing protein [Desulfurococcaceae archaeon TW002]
MINLVKTYTPRRLREKNRWLRSDGKPNFKDRLYSREPELSPLIKKDVPPINTLATVLRVCELMSSHNTRLIAVTSGKVGIIGVVTAMDIVDYLGGGSKHGLVSVSGFETIHEVLNLNIGKIMNENPVFIDINTPLYRVLELMVNYGLGAIPVTKEDSYVGVLTELEIMKYLSVKYVGVPVHKVMTKEVFSINSGASLEEAMWMMISLGVRRLPVIDDDQLKGMLTWKNIIDLVGTHKIYEILRYGLLREFKSLRVSDVMSTNVDVVSPYTDLGEVASMISKTATSSLLVVEGGVVVGIITERDVIYGLVVS